MGRHRRTGGRVLGARRRHRCVHTPGDARHRPRDREDDGDQETQEGGTLRSLKERTGRMHPPAGSMGSDGIFYFI